MANGRSHAQQIAALPDVHVRIPLAVRHDPSLQSPHVEESPKVDSDLPVPRVPWHRDLLLRVGLCGRGRTLLGTHERTNPNPAHRVRVHSLRVARYVVLPLDREEDQSGALR